MIDSNFPANAPSLLREIRKTTDKPVRFVFNSHHHGDHIYGNRFWAEQGAAIIAYAGLIEELKRYETGFYTGKAGRWEEMADKRADLKAYPLLPPEVIFDKDLILEDKNRRVILFHSGVGHTKGDGMAWLEEEQILFTGDACLNGPYNKLQDAHINSWMETLERIKGFHARLIVPGHGDLGSESTIEKQQQYFRLLYEWMERENEKGSTWGAVHNKLNHLRKRISSDEDAKEYLVPEPPVMASISLEAHAKKVFDEISAKGKY